MAKLQEIETKWNGDRIHKDEFNSKLKKLIKDKKMCARFLSVAGFDYYFTSKHGHTIRHRVSPNTRELTVKARMSSKSITVRAEGNIHLAKCNDPKEVHGTLNLLGFHESLVIYKDCDIYFIRDGKYDISVVWYTVRHKGRLNRVFLEVEIHGVAQKKSLVKLKTWHKYMKKMFHISDKDINTNSLFEIYTDKKYRMIK